MAARGRAGGFGGDCREGGRGLIRVVERRDLLFRVCLVRVLVGGDEPVYDRDQQDAAEKGARVRPVAPVLPVRLNQGFDAAVEYLDKGDVQHHARGEPGCDRQEPVIGPWREEGDNASNAGGHAGEQGQAECEQDIFHLNENQAYSCACHALYSKYRLPATAMLWGPNLSSRPSMLALASPSRHQGIATASHLFLNMAVIA